jgi:hypothetical protein
MTQTLVDYIREKLTETPKDVGIQAIRSTADVVDGVYTINLAWLKQTEDDNYQALPECNPGQEEFFLTDEEELTVKPTFKKERRVFDAALEDELPYVPLSDYNSEIQESGIAELKQTFNEIHLSEEQLIAFAEGDGSFARGTDFVTVKKDAELGEKVGVPTIKFTFVTRFAGELTLDNMHMKKRFSHVSTVRLAGTEYPAILEYTAYGGNAPDGGMLYASEFVADADGGPQFPMEESINNVDWRSFYESTSEVPTHLFNRQFRM